MSSTPSWSERTVLVTGATGLVGSCLVADLLALGARVVALVRDWDPQSELLRSGLISRCIVVSGQIEDLAAIERAITVHDVDTVFHLAAQPLVGAALRDPVGCFESNVRGTWNLLEACRRQKTLVRRVLIASSDKAYGESLVLPYTEEMPLAGKHPYDVSKSCADLISQTYHHTYGLPIVVARCGNIYGPGDLNWSRIVPGTIRSFHLGQRPIIRSDGKFLRDYVYVRDASLAYLCMADAAERPEVQGQSYNFGPGAPLAVVDVVAAIAREMGCEHLTPIIQDEARAEIRDQYLASEKAERALGWTPKWTFEQGIRETLPWYQGMLGGSDVARG